MNKMQEFNHALVATQYAMHARKWTDARDWADKAVAIAEELGGQGYVNPFWHAIRLSEECTMPGEYFPKNTLFGMTTMEWPVASTGDVVEIDNNKYRVCLNLCSDPKYKGVLEPLFGVYVTLPA